MFVLSTGTITNNQRPRNRHLGALICISVASCALTVILLLSSFSIVQPSAAVFPYEPILRSTTTVDDTRPLSLPGTPRNAVFVQATVPPVRTVVLGADGRIREIWSNTAGNVYHYTLYVRREGIDGPLLDYSPNVHTQYAMLIPLIDWRPSGRVYPEPERVAGRVAFLEPLSQSLVRE